jgi:hypothetical protein
LAGHRATGASSAAGHGRSQSGGSSFSRQAARGGATIAAFDAWRRGDSEAARDLGVDLSMLTGLSNRHLCVHLVDIVLGPPAHPEDVALRKTLITLLRRAMNEQPQPSVAELLSRLVESLAWELSAVQIASDLRTNQISETKARTMEKKVKRFIGGSVRKWSKTLTDHSSQFIVNYASRLAARACKALGDGR